MNIVLLVVISEKPFQKHKTGKVCMFVNPTRKRKVFCHI